MAEMEDTQDIRAAVRERYGKIAETAGRLDSKEAQADQYSAGCGCSSSSSSCCSPGEGIIDIASIGLYETAEVQELPVEVTGLSLGCGDPITLASLQPGQTVLDLGSGGGIDCFLAGKKVGPQGRVIGVDMTPAMLERARANKIKLEAENVEFRLGEIEHLPVADETVDVIISNCVINLSPDKPQVLREAWRVLMPGGRLAISDVATEGPLPAEIKQSLSAWAGCIAGALDISEYRAILEAAGFIDIQVEPVYLPREAVDEAVKSLGEAIPEAVSRDERIYRTVFSARITARKPETTAGY